jgi:uncharacterized protein (DUF1015 family)
VELRPFRSIRYSRATIAQRGLAALIGWPDRIGFPAPESVGHLVASDDPDAAGKTYQDWLAAGILETERRPGLWLYRQTFFVEGRPLVRDALVGLVRLGAAEKGPILDPHEPPDRQDVDGQLALLRALRADFSPSFLITRAPLSGRLATTRRPELSAVDADGVRHDCFRIADYAAHVELQGTVKNAEAILAEGADRFATALEFSKDAAATKLPGAKYKLCAIVEMDSPGVVVRPVHRLLRGIADWNPEHLVYAASDFFETREFASPADALAGLDSVSRLRAAFVLVAPPSKPALFVLRDRPSALPWPADRSITWRELDVAAVDVALLSRLLGTSREDASFTSDTAEALAAVEGGNAQAAILMRPLTTSEIETVVHDGDRLPPHAASFHPPVLPGLFGVALEDPVY